MHSEVAWVLVSSGTQVQPQIILNPDYLADYVSVSYDDAFILLSDLKSNPNVLIEILSLSVFSWLIDVSLS